MTSADELKGRSGRKFGYRTPEKLFDTLLNRISAAQAPISSVFQDTGCASISVVLTIPPCLLCRRYPRLPPNSVYVLQISILTCNLRIISF